MLPSLDSQVSIVAITVKFNRAIWKLAFRAEYVEFGPKVNVEKINLQSRHSEAECQNRLLSHPAKSILSLLYC